MYRCQWIACVSYWRARGLTEQTRPIQNVPYIKEVTFICALMNACVQSERQPWPSCLLTSFIHRKSQAPKTSECVLARNIITCLLFHGIYGGQVSPLTLAKSLGLSLVEPPASDYIVFPSICRNFHGVWHRSCGCTQHKEGAASTRSATLTLLI